MKSKPHKHAARTAHSLNISLSPWCCVQLKGIIKRLGFSGPSDYFQARIRLDSGLHLAHA